MAIWARRDIEPSENEDEEMDELQARAEREEMYSGIEGMALDPPMDPEARRKWLNGLAGGEDL